MKQSRRRFNPYGLRARLGISLAVSAVICMLAFLIISSGLDYLFTNYYERSDFERNHVERQHESLQAYIDENGISSDDLSLLEKWENKQPIIVLELYTDNQCIYSSVHDMPVSISLLEEESDADYMNLKLKDRQVTAFLYSDFTYQFQIIGKAISIVAALILFILLFIAANRKMIQYILRLNEEVQILEGGNLEYSVSEEGHDEITDLARSMNRMRITLQQQMETEQQLHQANRKLITEMSHDLRTPLTGIMLYLEILRSHRYESEEQLNDYLERIDAKAHHLKLLSDHLFEYAQSDALEKQTEPISMDTAFGMEVKGMVEELKTRGYLVETELEWKSCFVQVNPEYVHRIFENIISNMEKYAEKKAVIRIDTLHMDGCCGFSVMNTLSPKQEPVESNGVGIESIRNMMKQMGGSLSVDKTEATFEMTLLFPIQ